MGSPSPIRPPSSNARSPAPARWNRLPDPTNPLIVLRAGRPVLASASIGAGLHPHTLQRLVSVLEDGLDPAAALAVPALHLAAWDASGRATAQVTRDVFDAELLELVRDPSLTFNQDALRKRSALERFKAGQLGMILGYRSLTPKLREQNMVFDVMPLPRLGSGATVATMSGLCISEGAPAGKAADLLT